MKKIIFVAVCILLAALLFIIPTVLVEEDYIDHNGLNTKERCLVKANDKFLKYLEDNSTTYEFAGATINLPYEDGVIEDAKEMLEVDKSRC